MLVLRDDLVHSAPWMAILLVLDMSHHPKHWALCSETGSQGFLVESYLLRGFMLEERESILGGNWALYFKTLKMCTLPDTS